MRRLAQACTVNRRTSEHAQTNSEQEDIEYPQSRTLDKDIL